MGRFAHKSTQFFNQFIDLKMYACFHDTVSEAKLLEDVEGQLMVTTKISVVQMLYNSWNIDTNRYAIVTLYIETIKKNVFVGSTPHTLCPGACQEREGPSF